jgi:5S rRNA maturation endonuclease (ribonuclease M5)
VEDAISAIKISENIWVDTMPLLGSSIPKSKITKIADMGYKDVIVWLDHDKYTEAVRISDQLKYAGPDSFVVRSDLDPKCYTIDMIARKLDLVK